MKIEELEQELRDCADILEEFAERNFWKNPMHKVVCARKLARINTILGGEE